jgi:predicted SAM-dependent methyltransferase
LMLGVPHDNKPVTLAWALSYHGLHPPMNYDTRLCIVQGKPVDEARNEIAQSALDQGCKYLFFNDTDVTCPPHSIRQLIWHLEHYPNYMVAGGVYCHKAPPQMPMVFRGNGIGPYMDWKIGEVFDISGIGMGCTLIRTEIFKKLSKPWFKTVDDISQFMEGVNSASMWTEDLYFCYKVKTESCRICGKPEKEHKAPAVTDEKTPQPVIDHAFEAYGIMADGGILCQHWDTMANVGYSLPLNSKPYKLTLGMTSGPGKKKIVDMGCGPIEDSYRSDEGETLRVDIREDVKPDFRCDIRHTPFASAEFDVVFSSHTVEHFSRFEVNEVITEMSRILKADGELRLVMPNMKWAAQHIMNDEVDVDVMNVLYGAQTYAENFHKAGYTPEMLEQLLRQHGFTKFVWDFANYHMMVRAWKKQDAEVPMMNPVFTVRAVEVGKMVDEFEDGHDPKVEVDKKAGVVKVYQGEKQYEGALLTATDAGDGTVVNGSAAGTGGE